MRSYGSFLSILAASISARIWRTLAPYQRRHKRALENLAIAYPEKTPEEREKIALRMWDNLGRVMAETMQIDRIIADPARMEIAGRHVFERYRGRLGPVIGVSLHMGNWEFAIWPLTLAGARPPPSIAPSPIRWSINICAISAASYIRAACSVAATHSKTSTRARRPRA